MPSNPEAFKRVRTIIEGFAVTEGDLKGPLLTRLGTIHRAQERRVFSTQSQGEIYPWRKLSPAYAAAKKRLLGTVGKILVLSGETKERFIKKSRREYRQFYNRPYMSFGAVSNIASYHFKGHPPLPRRDMITKSSKQLRELRTAILAWYRNERVPQALRGAAALRRGRAA
jgi:hypothetical protein